MEDQTSGTVPTPASGKKATTATPIDMDLLLLKLDRIEDRLKHLEEKQLVSNDRPRRQPAVAAHVQLKQALISRLQMLEGRIMQLRSAMETPAKTNLASNEIVEVPLLQEGGVDAASVEKADNLIDKRFNRGYRRLQQAQKTGLTVKDPKQGRKKGGMHRNDKRGHNKTHGRLYRCFAMGC